MCPQLLILYNISSSLLMLLLMIVRLRVFNILINVILAWYLLIILSLYISLTDMLQSFQSFTKNTGFKECCVLLLSCGAIQIYIWGKTIVGFEVAILVRPTLSIKHIIDNINTVTIITHMVYVNSINCQFSTSKRP